MSLLKEMFDTYDLIPTTESAKGKKAKTGEKVKVNDDAKRAFSSFLGGNMFVNMPPPVVLAGKMEAEETNEEMARRIVSETKKPSKSTEDKVAGKMVNAVLQTKKGGRHFSPKTDYKRSHEKHEARKGMCEDDADGSPE